MPASRAATVPCVHGNANIRLSQRRSVIGTVAAHCNELAFGLLIADQPQLVLRCRLGQEVIDTRFGGNGSCGDSVVAGDHDRADAHAAQLVEALSDAALDDILEMNDAEKTTIACDRQRRSSFFRNDISDRLDFANGFTSGRRMQLPGTGTFRDGCRRSCHVGHDGVDRAFADPARAHVNAAHPGLSRKWLK